jgi:hypothetical protein
MKINEFDVDLIAYMALSEVAKNDSTVNRDDLNSKVAIHARKLKDNPSNIVIRL